MAKKREKKWAAVIDGLPKMVGSANGEETTRREDVDAAKADIRARLKADYGSEAAWAISSLYAKLRAEKDRLAELASAINLSVQALTELAAARFEAEDLDEVPLGDEGVFVSWDEQPTAVIKDRDLVRKWALENGFERSLQMNWNTLNSEMKSRLDKGLGMMPGVEAVALGKLKMRKMTDKQRDLLADVSKRPTWSGEDEPL